MIADIRKKEVNLFRTALKIDGMMCGMCEAHICDTIRKAVPEAKKVSASKNKKEASFFSETVPDGELLKKEISENGYTCLSVQTEPYEKKGLFGIL